MTAWPTVLSPRIVTPELASVSDGARSINGKEQVRKSDAGYWQIVYNEIPIASRAHKLAWRALSAALNGRVGTCDVPALDTQWQDPEPVYGTCQGGAALGVVAMTIATTSGQAEPGRAFSVLGAGGLYRMYRIKTVISQTSQTGGANVLSVKVSPPLREAIANGATLEFNAPLCTCRLHTDREMETGADDYQGRTLAKITFDEALP